MKTSPQPRDRVSAASVNPVRQQNGEPLPIRVQPQAGPGEAGVTERAHGEPVAGTILRVTPQHPAQPAGGSLLRRPTAV